MDACPSVDANLDVWRISLIPLRQLAGPVRCTGRKACLRDFSDSSVCASVISVVVHRGAHVAIVSVTCEEVID